MKQDKKNFFYRPLLICMTFFFAACDNNDAQKISQLQPVDTVITFIDTSMLKVVGLPRPNSMTFSFEEAEKRKNEIYDMALTVKHFDWINPTTGGAVHINNKDSVEVYHFTFGIYGRNDTATFYSPSTKHTSVSVKAEEVWNYVMGIGLGNATSILITSEYDLKKSASIKTIMDTLFKPGVQIYYLKRK